MGLIDDDAIVLTYRNGIIGCQHTFNHRLHCGDMHFCLGVRESICKRLDIVDFIKTKITFRADLTKGVLCLFTQCTAVYKKEDALEEPGSQKTVHQRNNRSCFSRTCRHGYEYLALFCQYSLFYLVDSCLLVLS